MLRHKIRKFNIIRGEIPINLLTYLMFIAYTCFAFSKMNTNTICTHCKIKMNKNKSKKSSQN